ncbi:MAG TPA: SDR family NAD(P)-dependent oxidoreductase [Gaiellales bacterium]|nr:SDR family NAD(P)-dependent oxidoreductase [Gaiellales bacterium]
MDAESRSRVAVVTGAAGGIGAAVAARLAADGYAVAGADVDDGADHRCDVRSEADVKRLCDEVTARLGAPSLLVNVAGVFFEHRITELAADDWDLILDTNLKGTFLTCKTFLPAMIEAGSGCIVNIASTAGIRGGHTRAAYCAAKAGVVNLTRSLALDHGGDGVRICCVCPGLIDTPMADWITSRPDALREFEEGVPARRIGTAADIAGAVSFLASADASYAHGSVLVVDGGVTA